MSWPSEYFCIVSVILADFCEARREGWLLRSQSLMYPVLL
jgi:hypothetical protein